MHWHTCVSDTFVHYVTLTVTCVFGESRLDRPYREQQQPNEDLAEGSCGYRWRTAKHYHGTKYFLTVVEEYSSYCDIMPVQQKSAIPQELINVIAE